MQKLDGDFSDYVGNVGNVGYQKKLFKIITFFEVTSKKVITGFIFLL